MQQRTAEGVAWWSPAGMWFVALRILAPWAMGECASTVIAYYALGIDEYEDNSGITSQIELPLITSPYVLSTAAALVSAWTIVPTKFDEHIAAVDEVTPPPSGLSVETSSGRTLVALARDVDQAALLAGGFMAVWVLFAGGFSVVGTCSYLSGESVDFHEYGALPTRTGIPPWRYPF